MCLRIFCRWIDPPFRGFLRLPPPPPHHHHRLLSGHWFLSFSHRQFLHLHLHRQNLHHHHHCHLSPYVPHLRIPLLPPQSILRLLFPLLLLLQSLLLQFLCPYQRGLLLFQPQQEHSPLLSPLLLPFTQQVSPPQLVTLPLLLLQ